MKWIPTKTLLSRVTRPECWFGGAYNMNIYRGCSHGCIYCDSRSDCCRVTDFEAVAAKENALGIIENEYVRTFGESYHCPVANHQGLNALFRGECDRLGLVYRMPDTIQGFYYRI